MARRHLALPAVLLGPAVALWLVVLAPFPGDGGPVTFALRAAQLLLLLVGAGLFVLGVRGYRTGAVRPAVAAATAVTALAVVGAAGAYYETNVGFLVPVWVWVVAGVAGLALSLVGAYRFVPDGGAAG